jgi:hypothetical protein
MIILQEGYNNANAFGIFTTDLTTAQVSTLSSIINAFQTSLGRNTY